MENNDNLNSENNKKKKEFFCHLCNYKTHNCNEWIKHNECKKHKRNGELLPKDCSICGYKGYTHWNLKMHMITNHSTLEERKTQRFYCSICDVVFFSQSYNDKHYAGKRHKNMELALKYQNEIDNIPPKE